tara:strand:- start:194 stop:352 length:159 start_codon:yes stop_codon:yes gene_type:complete
MGWKKENRPPHYLFPISEDFSEDWKEFKDKAAKDNTSIANQLRKAVQKWNDE